MEQDVLTSDECRFSTSDGERVDWHAQLSDARRYAQKCQKSVSECMVRRPTARGLKLIEVTVCANVSGLLVEKSSPGTQ